MSYGRAGAQSSMSAYSSVSTRTGRQLVQAPPRDKEGSKKTVPLKPSEVVPSSTYIERGLRWMEKEEAVSLRTAIEDMDYQKEDEEEARLHAAAQKEASELVWEHQNPNEARPDIDAPYRYKEHLRKNSYAHARTQSVGRYGGLSMATGLARDLPPRSVSGSSSGSGGRSRVVSGETQRSASIDTRRPSHDSARPQDSTRRRSIGKRNISGETAPPFSGDQIWEEPARDSMDEGMSAERNLPAPLRLKARNPLNRVQFVEDLEPRSSSAPLEPTKRVSTSEIHRNPPSQSRNPAYTSNPLPKAERNVSAPPEDVAMTPPQRAMSEGLEIRSDDIRQATSMRMKDRSPKLPTPTVVSNKAGRPIVSFAADWQEKEADAKPEASRRFDPRGHDSKRQSFSARPDSKVVATPIPTICLPDAPTISVNSVPSVPVFNIQEAPSVPTIVCPDVPTISIPPILTINAPEAAGKARPLPDPKAASSRPKKATPFGARGHWSPQPQAGKRATTTCHQCQLPIEGRVVSLRGVAERFHPECFICYTCGTGLEALEISPEPEPARQSRLDRIQRRAEGEDIPEVEGQTLSEDGDTRLRFFCHLDWHEQFAPRCKHCTTPIIGEHVVALGEHWHYGHFFCAECGDPFEQGMTHIEKDGYAWCLSCQTRRTENKAPKCVACKKPVIGQYVEALGGEYHDECFRCAACDGGFDDGQIFPRDVKGGVVVLCTGCRERELKA